MKSKLVIIFKELASSEISVKLHVNTEVKPIATPPRSVPYHLKERASKVIEDLVKQDIIEEHSINEPAPWVSNTVIAPKPD